jgi:ammonium transporter, Amt family
VGGILGTLLAGVFAAASVTVSTDAPAGTPGLLEGNPHQLLVQAIGVAVTILWCGAGTFVLLKVVGMFTPLRVAQSHEMQGLDITQHGESIHA